MSEPRILMTSVALGESPRWHDGRLWFSDCGAQEIIALAPDGTSEVMLQAPSLPFCIDWLPDGRLLIVSGREGLLLRQEPDGSLATYADLTSISRHPWNDIVVDGRGNTYVNTVGFDFPGGQFAPGFVALVTPNGTVQQVADELAFPNGMAVTPDNSTLIVAESYGERLTAFNIAEDGSLSNRRVWADTPGDHPDGICLDADGAVWYADVGSSHCVRVREGGEVVRTVTLDRGCFACMLGGAERKTLYIVAARFPDAMNGGERTGQVIAVEAPAPHAGWP